MHHKPTALFIGRFQPYHIGHHLVIQGMTKVCGKIVIGIGSAGAPRNPDNPYSAAERKEMIQRALQDENLIPMFDINFVEIPDTSDDAAWAVRALELAGTIDTVWTGNEQIKKAFEGRVAIKEIKEAPGVSATSVREMVRAGGKWEEKVPAEIARAMREIGLERIKGK